MNDAHVYEMQVQMWKPNTWGVTMFNAVAPSSALEGLPIVALLVSEVTRAAIESRLN